MVRGLESKPQVSETEAPIGLRLMAFDCCPVIPTHHYHHLSHQYFISLANYPIWMCQFSAVSSLPGGWHQSERTN